MTTRLEARFLTEVCGEVAEAWIDDDANVLGNLLRTLQMHAPPALWEPNPDVKPADALKWWGRRGGLRDHLQWLRPVLQAGEQPVFASVSLCVPGSATPTIYIPVPYAIKSYHSLRELLWPAPPGDAESEAATERNARLRVLIEKTPWEPLARTVSHALANVSHTMRVGDRPTYGWLAYAHASSKLVYLQDLTRVAHDALTLEEHFDLRNAATSEEVHVGMASALYIPLWNEQLVKVQVEGSEYAQAVLLLWSPVPNRWDRLYPCDPSTPVEVADHSEIRRTLSNGLSWIRGVISKESRSQKTTEAQVLALLHGLAVSSTDRGGDRSGILHGLGTVLAPLRSAHVPSPSPLMKWLEFQFSRTEGATDGLRNILETQGSRSLGTVPVVFLEHGRESRRILLGDWSRERDSLPWREVDLALDWEVAVRLGADPADNIDKFGQELSQIKIDRSEKYITIRYCLVPKPSAKRLIFGTSEGLKRYYAVRRGLPVTPGQVESDRSGYGLGLLLHRVVAGRHRVYRFLYLSADGSECMVEQALPILQHAEGEYAQDTTVRGRSNRGRRASRGTAASGAGPRARD
jgi:hypothetical protein